MPATPLPVSPHLPSLPSPSPSTHALSPAPTTTHNCTVYYTANKQPENISILGKMINKGPAPFRGATSKTNPNAWIADYIYYCKFIPLSEEQMAAAFPLHLDREAKLWYRGLDKRTDDWDRLQASFKTNYSITSTKWPKQASFLSACESPNQSVKEYAYFLGEQVELFSNAILKLLCKILIMIFLFFPIFFPHYFEWFKVVMNTIISTYIILNALIPMSTIQLGNALFNFEPCTLYWINPS